MYGTILAFIKLNSFGTRRLNGLRRLLHSFCCTSRHIFEQPLRVYEPGFNTDKYGTENPMHSSKCFRSLLLPNFIPLTPLVLFIHTNTITVMLLRQVLQPQLSKFTISFPLHWLEDVSFYSSFHFFLLRFSCKHLQHLFG